MKKRARQIMTTINHEGWAELRRLVEETGYCMEDLAAQGLNLVLVANKRSPIVVRLPRKQQEARQ